MMATASNAIPNIVLLLNLSIIDLKQFIYLLKNKKDVYSIRHYIEYGFRVLITNSLVSYPV